MEKFVKHKLEKLGLFQRTEYIDITSGKRKFRIARINALDSAKHPQREYYTTEDGNEIFYMDNNTLYQELWSDEYNAIIYKMLPMSRVILEFGKYDRVQNF